MISPMAATPKEEDMAKDEKQEQKTQEGTGAETPRSETLGTAESSESKETPAETPPEWDTATHGEPPENAEKNYTVVNSAEPATPEGQGGDQVRGQ